MKPAGHNIFCIRLYERTGPGTGADDRFWPAGSMDLLDVLARSRRAATLGLQFQLTLHYSDFWTNSKTQDLPHRWAKHLVILPKESARMADQARANGAEWDVIGCRHYPTCTGKTIEKMAAFSAAVTQRYQCDLLVTETGFNWTPNQPNGRPGQLNNTETNSASKCLPNGQRELMTNLCGKLRKVPRVQDVLYWVSIMIATLDVGWAWREGTAEAGHDVISNTTLYDFSGTTLPVFDIWKEHTQ